MSTQTLEAKLSTTVHQFKQNVNVIVADFLSQTLGAATAGATARNGKSNGKSNGHAVKASNGASRAKGEKRTQEDLDAMQKQFVDFVGKNPGLRIEQVNKQLGTTTKDLQLPIRKAIADGLVKTKGEKRSTQYFAR